VRAMELDRPRTPLVMRERPMPVPAAGEILIEISACGVCRTDLHVVDGDLPDPKLPIIPGHEIVGRVAACGAGVLEHFSIRFGVPRVCEISFAFFFRNTFEKRGDCSPKFLNSARLHFA